MAKYNRLFKCIFVFCLIILGSSYGCAQINIYEDSHNYKEAISSLGNNEIHDGLKHLNKEILLHPDNGYAYL